SPRPGTAAAGFDGQVPKEVVQERFERLVELQERISLAANEALVGSTVELLIEGEGRKGGAQGRTRTNKVVHVDGRHVPGTFLDAEIVSAHPHHLSRAAGARSRPRSKGRAFAITSSISWSHRSRSRSRSSSVAASWRSRTSAGGERCRSWSAAPACTSARSRTVWSSREPTRVSGPTSRPSPPRSERSGSTSGSPPSTRSRRVASSRPTRGEP